MEHNISYPAAKFQWPKLSESNFMREMENTPKLIRFSTYWTVDTR